MGKYSEPKEKDYSKDKAGFAAQELARRKAEAAKYNASVSNYNTSMNNISKELSTLGNSMSKMTIKDDELWQKQLRQMSALEGRFNGLSAPNAAPSWGSTVNSPYGAVDVAIPTLASINTQLGGGFSSKLSSLRDLISGLQADRKTEEGRIQSYASELQTKLAGFGSQLDGYTIADLDGLNSTRSGLAELMGAVKAFRSPILSEYQPPIYKNFDNRYATLTGRLNKIFDQRKAEESRISGYESDLNSGYDNLNSMFSGLGIADIRDMESLQKLIDGRQLNASRFSSQLDFDLSDELSSYDDLESRLGGLMSDRKNELSRIEDAQRGAKNGIMSILQQLGGAGIYDLGALNDIGRQLDQGASDISNFKSDLDFDFSDVLGQVGDARSQLAGLMTQRNSEMSRLSGQGTTLLNQINGYDLSDEASLMAALEQAEGLQDQFGQFTGGNNVEAQNQLRDVVTAARGRLNSLGQERSTIEREARQLLNNSRAKGFGSTADVDNLAAQLAALTGRQVNFGADQALDEIDSIASLISSGRDRLTAEAKSAEERAAAERQSFLASSGQGGFGGYVSALAPWLNGGSGYGYGLPSSFARQLNVVYA